MKSSIKRISCLCLALCMLVSLAAGCSSSGGGQSTQTTASSAASSQTQTTAAPEKTEVTTLKLGHIFAQDGSANLAAEKFAELVSEKTDGAYVIEIYPNCQLGDERELCEAVTMGTVDMTLCGDSFIGWYVPEYSSLCAFFTWKSFDHAEKAYRGEIGAELTKAYSDKCNTTVLDYWMRAPRYLCSQKEIHNLSDLKGLTLRIPDDTLYYESFKALGANPTPLSFDEIYLALKQGTINALENPLEDLYNNSFYDVTKYVIETAHQISMFALMINDDVLAGLPADVQQILKDCALEAGDYQNDLMKAAQADYKKKLEDKGMTFIVPDDLQDWYDIINTEVPPKFAGTWKQGLLEQALALA
ncbi:MAG: TRAP transporter substrate-binding protein [Clostridia bacterium]|nr:TRAP transporter substrate-binding protein [Clostridia bacterium]